MKLLVVGILLYVIQLFILPFGVEAVMPYVPSGLLADPRLSIALFYMVPMTVFSGLAAFAYARWAQASLTLLTCIALALAFLLMPVMAYLLKLGVAFYVNPLLAVEGLQEIVVPMFQSFEGGDLRLVNESIAYVPYVAPALLGPAIASFFARTEAIAQARFLMDDTSDDQLKL